MVQKNLAAHRFRNRKTGMMFSISLGIIMFIQMCYKTQINQFKFYELHLYDKFSFYDDSDPGISAEEMRSYEHYFSRQDYIDSWSWVTQPLLWTIGNTYIKNKRSLFWNT
eukprot:UN27952